MWPTPIARPGAPSGWSAMSLRARRSTVFVLCALVALVGVMAWLSIRFAGTSAPVYVNSSVSSGALWAFDGVGYRLLPGGGGGPRSNSVDIAYDASSGVLVAWDHGCARLVMGFTGGCLDSVNQTWTWNGSAWALAHPRSSPLAVGTGVMLYGARLGGVAYVNGAGQAWSWNGHDWSPLPLAGGPSVPWPGSMAGPSTFAAGYDTDRGALVVLTSSRTWVWDGSRWTAVAGGVDPAEARGDAHLVYDAAHLRMVYVGSHATWTWDGTSWTRHDQPAIESGTLAYDSALDRVVLVVQDAVACARSACLTQTWVWDGSSWRRLNAQPPLQLSITRLGASAPPLDYDSSAKALLLLANRG